VPCPEVKTSPSRFLGIRPLRSHKKKNRMSSINLGHHPHTSERPHDASRVALSRKHQVIIAHKASAQERQTRSKRGRCIRMQSPRRLGDGQDQSHNRYPVDSEAVAEAGFDQAGYGTVYVPYYVDPMVDGYYPGSNAASPGQFSPQNQQERCLSQLARPFPDLPPSNLPS